MAKEQATRKIEYVWRVDSADKPIGDGRQPRSYKVGVQEHRSRGVAAFVRNKEGDFWIPRRSRKSRIFKGMLDSSVAGMLDFPETYEQGFKRESQEEIGVNTDEVNTQFLAHLSPFTHNIFCWTKVYEIYLEDTPPFNPDVFSKGFWWSMKQVREVLESKPYPIKPGLAETFLAVYTPPNRSRRWPKARGK